MSAYAIPGAPGYAQAQANATNAYNTALAQINQRRLQTLRQAGYLGDIDPTTGTIRNMRVDPMNQYGGLQQMLRGQAQRLQGVQFANQERGLRGGLANKGIREAEYEAGLQAAQFGQGLTGDLGALQNQQVQAEQQKNQAIWYAQQAAAAEALQNQEFNEAPVNAAAEGALQYGEDPLAEFAPAPAAMRNVIGRGAQGQIRRGNTYISRNQLIKRLVAAKKSPSKWARQHPQAARQLGIGTKPGSNNRLIRQARRRRR